ncbi:hypothetical protein SFRURICE_009454, partial [Spodoptera frugiperda]
LKTYCQHGDLENYNVPFLQFSPTLIMDKKDCMKEYEVYPNMTYVIEQYMICTLESGNIDDRGEQINDDFTKMEGCSPAESRKNGADNLCEDYNDKEFNYRRDNDIIYNYTSYDYIKRAAELRYSNPTRRNGICQNDHGGPLVTWVGSREVVIGIASVFKITEENACIGPFLYTSTQRRLDLCDSPPSVKGFDIVRNHISWKDHPAGRIINGNEVSEDKTYVVYLVKAPFSQKIYDSWLCGGALVSKEFILTSAACVEDVDYLYAIAGYRKYIKDKFIEYDDCTKTMKKKVIYTCVPVAYEFSYDEIEKWSYIDIALVKVESPYNLFDARFQIMCSYIPSIIRINFDPKHQVPGTEAMVLGWGHTEMWREHGDKVNYNQEILHYSATLLMDKQLCKDHYKDYPEMLKTIDTYMLCSLDAGHMNDKGEIISSNHTLVDGCVTQQEKLMGETGDMCPMEPYQEPILVDYVNYPRDETRKRMNANDTIDDEDSKNSTESENTQNFNFNDTFVNENIEYRISRRNGICQNDHGGPLIGWIGKREVVIGIASVFKIDEENRCIGPYLYTSTVCNSAFIHCTLNEEPPKVPIPKNNNTNDRPADNEKALRSKPERKEDKFATRVESDKDSNENNPLRDRNTQQPQSLDPSKNLGYSPNFGSPLNLGPPPNSGPSQNLGYPQNQRPSQNLGSQQNLGPPQNLWPLQNLGPPQHLEPSHNLGPLQYQAPPYNQGLTQNLRPPQNLGTLQNLGPSQNMGPPPNLGRPPNQEFQQNSMLQQNMRPPLNQQSLNQGFQQYQDRPLNQEFQQNQNLGPPQNLMPYPNLESPQNLGYPQNPGKRFAKEEYKKVYLVKAPIASAHYDFWLCGGALVTSEYVVTSAACIKDVDYLYVIAGYNKYVTDAELETDQCTSKMKKKVIYTCYPEGYEIRYERLDKWALIDIGVVKVESPYDFTDESYKTTCSYIPAVIPVSYEAKYQEAGTDAIVFGWGHLFKWRKIKKNVKSII